MKMAKLFKVMIICLLVINFQNVLFAEKSSVIVQRPLQIFKIESLNQISNDQPIQTLYFFDIDDTLFDSPSMLGSKAWRKYIAAATKEDLTQNWHDVFSLFIARKHPVEAVESITSQFVQDLQMMGHPVFGLTARERTTWYDTPMNDIDLLTISQLESVGINFNIETLNKLYPHLTQSPEYFKGVFFADLEPKGEYLLKLFKESSQIPTKVIFIDDKQSQVESVASALDKLGINYECYWYTPTDNKASKFDPLIANIQLYYFWMSDGNRLISDEEAILIAGLHPDRNAEYYLQSLFRAIKSEVIKKEPGYINWNAAAEMQEKIGSLNENKNFAFVDLGLSNEDLKLVDQFKIDSSQQYDRFGNLDLLLDELPNFLQKIGNNDEHLIQKITRIIYKVASNVIKASHKETAWVCLRASTPSRAFDEPRWHWDGYYYPPYSGFAFKFAATLKGNPTLFYQLKNDLRGIFELHFNDREFLSNLLDRNFIESPRSGEGAFFLVGDRECAAAHSEPKLDCERLFFSVLPGNENEIAELNARWN